MARWWLIYTSPSKPAEPLPEHDPWWDTWAQRDDCCWTWRSKDGWDHPDYLLEPDDELPF